MRGFGSHEGEAAGLEMEEEWRRGVKNGCVHRIGEPKNPWSGLRAQSILETMNSYWSQSYQSALHGFLHGSVAAQVHLQMI